MLFNSADRCLYIFGGQRKRDEYLNDFFTFHVDTEVVRFLADGNSSRYMPRIFFYLINIEQSHLTGQ
jgi:hypothetical protein